jgi:hypothetical protein
MFIFSPHPEAPGEAGPRRMAAGSCFETRPSGAPQHEEKECGGSMVPPRRDFQPFFVIAAISRLDHFMPSF